MVPFRIVCIESRRPSLTKLNAANVQRKYPIELHKLVKSLMLLILPALLIKTLKNVIWFASAESASPFGSSNGDAITNAGLATAWIVLLEFSWAYQALVYLFVCVLFRLMCSMQAIRIQAYIERLEVEVDVAAMLSHHMQLRDHMATISHQFALMYSSRVCFSVCMPGRSAYPNVQAALASTAVDGCLLFGNNEPRMPAGNTFVGSDGEGLTFKTALNGGSDGLTRAQHAEAEGEGKKSCVGEGLIKMLHRVGSGVATLVDITEIGKEPKNYESDAFHKRVAFVTYLQHCPCGITLYGFSMDRSFLYAIFGLVFSMATFIIGRAASANLPKESSASLWIGV
ncbi:unnamed protein product [Closterium sp. Yama58-4]|nr:unnamed protein product [Closterium sp. Yama58-4]